MGESDGLARKSFEEALQELEEIVKSLEGGKGSLAQAIAETTGRETPDAAVRVYARMVLQLQILAFENDDSEATIEAGFRILDEGWREER